MSPVNVMCFGCGFTGAVNRVTAGLRCTCGSADLDLYTGSDEQRAHLAKLRQPKTSTLSVSTAGQAPTFAQFMLGKKRVAAAPKTVEPNWDEYVGPPPGPNPMSNHVGPVTCPTCLGSKVDIKDDAGPCRACRGTGVITPTTTVTPPPAVAPHNYPSTQTKVPFMGQRRQSGRTSTDPLGSPEDHIRATTPDYSSMGQRGPESAKPFAWEDSTTHYPKADNHSPAMSIREPFDYTKTPDRPFEMPGSWCPGCGQGPLQLQKDHKENAWASCPTCGPLVDVDRNPQINPYDFPAEFAPNTRAYKAPRAANRLLAGRKTGRLLRMVSAVTMANPGLSRRHALEIARTSLRKYPESK